MLENKRASQLREALLLHRRSPLETPAFRQGEERGALDVALVFDILLDDLQGCAADSGDEIRVGPARGEPGLEGRELLTENTRRPSFDLLDESVDYVLNNLHHYPINKQSVV